MNKYLQIIKNTIAEYLAYRLNFVLWRFRMVVRLLVVYFLWQAIFSDTTQAFGYAKSQIITYIIFSQIVSTLVIATRTQDVGSEIQEGNLTNFLLRPISYFSFLLSRDAADKLLNIGFAIIEVFVFILLMHPAMFWQTNLPVIALSVTAALISMAVYFCISLILSFTGFWTQESWAPRFLFFIISDFFSGGLFPLDILPKPVYQALSFLPFPYILFFPLKIYLGQLQTKDIIFGFVVSILWVGILIYLVKYIWQKGLRLYTAEGR